MKVAVTGFNGRVGRELIGRGYLPLDCDITNKESVDNAVKSVKPDVIVNCAAKTDVDACEFKGIIEAYRVNAFSLENFLPYRDIKFVQLSTDYIFDGLNGPYDENAEPRPICSYGFTKRLAEMTVTELPDSLIIRTTILYDKSGKDFVGKVIEKLSSGQPVRVPNTLYGNPTYVPHLVDGIISAIDKNITGTVNIAGLETLSRLDLAEAVAKVFEFDLSLVTNGVAWGEAARPERAGFVLDKATRLGVPIFTLWQGLLDLKRELRGDASQIRVDNSGR